ncbi:MAG: VapC toxin family PIN domain ribonuclease [Chloroflexi bacterium]|nr:MAG: VapC toxin family PIN domain ribonuclease [Chloroflexota bacterium]
MPRVLIDVNIPMYAAGREHPMRAPCQRVVRALASGDLDGVTDAEVFQEILYRYLHIDERAKGFAIFDQFHRIMDGRILPVDDADVLQARALAERLPRLGARDLIHLAVMTRHGIDRILSVDRDFDTVEGIVRLDPIEFV